METPLTPAELEEFRQLILAKLETARTDFEELREALNRAASNDTQDTSPTFKLLEEGTSTFSKEESTRLAHRQLKFIQHLEAALESIANGTYGICRETGQPIPRARLRAVPHATLSIEAKNRQNS